MDTTGNGTMERDGVGGTVNGYGVPVLGDVAVIERDVTEIARRAVDRLG